MRVLSLCLLFYPLISITEGIIRLHKVAGPRGPLKDDNNDNVEIGSAFDYLMLTRIYPVAVCRADDDAVPSSCEIPQGTPTWSIHGLWPNFNNGSYPQFCHGVPRKFDPHLIESIVPQLTKLWPNLYPEKSVTSFWKHEWEKHGTCGQSDPPISSELLYFQTTMDLNKKWEIGTALKEAGIVPRSEPYSLEQIRSALKEKLTQGRNVQINCLKDKKLGESLLGDVRICLDRDLGIIDCPLDGSQYPPSIFLTDKPKYKPSIFLQDKVKDHSDPLPTFHNCPSSVYYLEDATHKETYRALERGLESISPVLTLLVRTLHTDRTNEGFLYFFGVLVIIACGILLRQRHVRSNDKIPILYSLTNHHA